MVFPLSFPYLTYIGAQKRAGARFCAPLGLYKARGTELIATWLPYKQKETLISSAEPKNFGFWYLSDARRMHFNVEILTIFKLGVKCLPESNSTRKVMLFKKKSNLKTHFKRFLWMFSQMAKHCAKRVWVRLRWIQDSPITVVLESRIVRLRWCWNPVFVPWRRPYLDTYRPVYNSIWVPICPYTPVYEQEYGFQRYRTPTHFALWS